MQGSSLFLSGRLAALIVATSVLSGCLDGSEAPGVAPDAAGYEMSDELRDRLPRDFNPLQPAARQPQGTPPQSSTPSSSPPSSSPPQSTPSAGGSTKNKAPVLSGNAPKTASVGQNYVFQPQVSDADGDKLTFSVSSKPSWASFDPKTGRLWGTPSATHVGSYEEISVSVTDGQATVALPEFEVAVVPSTASSGDVTLAWDPPMENTDGTTLTDLNGYKIYYGTKSGQYTKSIPLTNAGLTRYVVEDLAAGTYFFVITALSTNGGESEYSAEVAKKIG